MKEYNKHYSEESFWDKLKNFAKSAGCEVVEKALILFYVAQDKDTPAKIKAMIYGALGYFILPVDVIPDVTPAIGFSDDLGILLATITAVVAYTKKEHKQKAKETLSNWCEY